MNYNNVLNIIVGDETYYLTKNMFYNDATKIGYEYEFIYTKRTKMILDIKLKDN